MKKPPADFGKQSPKAGGRLNFLNVSPDIRKHRTKVRCFRCAAFQQHILVREAGLEPARA